MPHKDIRASPISGSVNPVRQRTKQRPCPNAFQHAVHIGPLLSLAFPHPLLRLQDHQVQLFLLCRLRPAAVLQKRARVHSLRHKNHHRRLIKFTVLRNINSRLSLLSLPHGTRQPVKPGQRLLVIVIPVQFQAVHGRHCLCYHPLSLPFLPRKSPYFSQIIISLF